MQNRNLFSQKTILDFLPNAGCSTFVFLSKERDTLSISLLNKHTSLNRSFSQHYLSRTHISSISLERTHTHAHLNSTSAFLFLSYSWASVSLAFSTFLLRTNGINSPSEVNFIQKSNPNLGGKVIPTNKSLKIV